MDQGEVKVKSLKKALEVLNCFTENQPLGVTEISEKLGLYKSNVHNILMTFKAMEYVEQDEESGRFYLGPAIFNLTRALNEYFDIPKVAIPYMKKIVEEVQELVYLAVPSGDEVIYLEAFYPEKHFLSSPPVRGERSKMYSTSAGKAVLSAYPLEELEQHISKELMPFTEFTITDKEQLMKELEVTRKRGYAFDNMEVIYGIKCVGVPILDQDKKPVAALSISTPSLRMTEDKIEKFVKVLKKYALEIEKRI